MVQRGIGVCCSSPGGVFFYRIKVCIEIRSMESKVTGGGGAKEPPVLEGSQQPHFNRAERFGEKIWFQNLMQD